MMELRHLVHAKALAEEGSFAAAADRVGLTQPALSKSIQALEAEAGIRLFDRSKRGVSPTVAGTALLRRAVGLLDGVADLKAELSGMRSGRLGKVHIGLGPLPAKLALAAAMTRFARDETGVEISAEIGSAPNLLMKLAQGELDFLIASLPPGTAIEGIMTTRVGLMPLALLARRGHPLFGLDAPGEADFARYPVLGGTFSEPLAYGRRSRDGGYHPLLSCDDYDLLARVALDSDALVVATPALTDFGWPYALLEALPLPASWPVDYRQGHLVLAVREGKMMAPAAGLVLAELRRHLDAALAG
ncbi:LysR family transcriptional regulator [Sphingopyxis sp. YF1]|uniref:LysR family transcriptional regulator n=1 Tax=Sphingopyxis sp. YF1 TaxID=2482763 RepID=UPI001F618695|nr:LysR family transcriptional regulator [Sphingopyxis sp. YF1]UNU42875.1 LysR family transcriptional regulator [Sphingopyxis sp. YF1]